MRYQTEIHVATDRYVCLQLPSFFPEGRATVIVKVETVDPAPFKNREFEETDRQDIEWWDDFDEGLGHRG